jgi:hypothetical protein
MSTTLVYEHTISFDISEMGIHLYNDNALHLLIMENPKQGVRALVRKLKQEFKNEKSRELEISEESLMTEIWGHHFFEKIYLPFRGIVKVLFLQKIVNRLDTSLKEYDCGEVGFDPNRWLWDLLSHFNGFFSLFLNDSSVDKQRVE